MLHACVIACHKSPSAFVIATSGVSIGCMMNLYLKNTVFDNIIVFVLFTKAMEVSIS